MRFLSRATLARFRCYDDAPLELGDMNVFAGPNNAGKSALLNALRRLVSVNLDRHRPTANPGGAAFWGPTTYLTLTPNDVADGATSCVLTLAVERAAYERKRRDVAADGQVNQDAKSGFQAATWPVVVRAEFAAEGGARLLSRGELPPAQDTRGNGEDARQAEEVIRLVEALPIVVLPEHRSFTGGLDLSEPKTSAMVSETAFTADALFPLFVEWSCEDRARVSEVETIAAEVLGSTIQVSCRPRTKELRVAINGAPPRSILEVGSGTMEVLVLAAALTKHDGGLLLYEEPELHLHPTVQRRLISVVRQCCTAGEWQALLTTHSNHILDCAAGPEVRRFEVRPGRHTRVFRVDDDRAAMLAVVVESLGARPSSMLAANTIVWVEGPSDAIYLGYFITQRAAECGISIEPTDFGFAFFGGANLRHVRLAATPPEELVDLFAVHPRSFVVFDSDRTASSAPLGKTYAAAFMSTALAGRVWVSAGREVENYLADAVLGWAATGIADGQIASSLEDRQFATFYDQVEALKVQRGRARAAHDASDPAKVAFARAAVQMMRDNPARHWLDRLDLRDRLDEVITFIRKACDGAADPSG